MLIGIGLKEQSPVMKEAAQVNPTERIVGEVAGVCVCYVGFVHHLLGPARDTHLADSPTGNHNTETSQCPVYRRKLDIRIAIFDSLQNSSFC